MAADGGKELKCLEGALDSGQGAELVVGSPTTEADPITEYYRVLPGGTTEVYVDSTRDEHSDQKWGFADCADPQSALDVNC